VRALLSRRDVRLLLAGQSLVTLVDVRIEIVIMALVTVFAAAYLFTRSETEDLVADPAQA